MIEPKDTETKAEKKADKILANKLADETPPYEQVGLIPPSGLNPFGGVPAASGAGGAFVDRKDKA